MTEATAAGTGTEVSRADLRRLVDGAAIRDVHLRYCHGVDRRDWDLVRSCYHEDAVDYHGPYNGGVEGFVAWGAEVCETIEIPQHLTGNQLVEIDGDTAWHEAYTTAFHRFKSTDTDPAMHWWLRVRYYDRMERRDGEWRIAERMVILDGQWRAPVEDLPGEWLWGKYDMSDPTYNRSAPFADYVAGQASGSAGPW
jgi:ketosteroid isomerase-like protein